MSPSPQPTATSSAKASGADRHHPSSPAPPSFWSGMFQKLWRVARNAPHPPLCLIPQPEVGQDLACRIHCPTTCHCHPWRPTPLGHYIRVDSGGGTSGWGCGGSPDAGPLLGAPPAPTGSSPGAHENGSCGSWLTDEKTQNRRGGDLCGSVAQLISGSSASIPDRLAPVPLPTPTLPLNQLLQGAQSWGQVSRDPGRAGWSPYPGRALVCPSYCYGSTLLGPGFHPRCAPANSGRAGLPTALSLRSLPVG